MWAAKAAAVAVAAAAAFTPTTTTVKDPSGDVKNSAMDLVRASLGRASNGQLRASLTTATSFPVKSMLPSAGVPGSACLRLWTKSRPGATPPDYLVCATAAKDGKSLDGSILQEREGATPVRVGAARATRSSSRNITLRFGQSPVGRPKLIHFAAETTAPGCRRLSCSDVAPQDGRTAAFRLRR
jgi:hypothetical protein